MVARIANWVTIITAPLAIFGTIATWLGWIGSPRLGIERSETATLAVAVLLIVVVWAFFFSGHLAVVAWLSRLLSDVVAVGASLLVSFITLIIFCCIEVLILVALVPDAEYDLVLITWIILPFLAWLFFGYYAVIFIASGEYRKDDVQP